MPYYVSGLGIFAYRDCDVTEGGWVDVGEQKTVSLVFSATQKGGHNRTAVRFASHIRKCKVDFN